MGLTEIYNAHFAETAPAEQTTEATIEKTASEDGEVADFGTLVAHYFNVGTEALLEKVAEETGPLFNPMAGLAGPSALGKTLGNVGDVQEHVNANATSGEKMHTMTGNSSPYAGGPGKLMQKAVEAQTILKKKVSSKAGDVGGYA